MGKEQLRHCIQRQLAIQVRDAVCIGKQHHFPINTSIGIGTIGVLPFMLRATIVQLQYISCNLKALQEQKINK